jgi:hypothetical protein
VSPAADEGREIYRPPAPRQEQRILWPDEFGLRFALFVDVEEEFDWTRPLDRANRATQTLTALPEGHAVFASHGLAPVYLVDHPIATDPAAPDLIGPLLTRGTAVGTQLHPWVNPPFSEDMSPHNSFAGNLGSELEAAKIDELGSAIISAFGRKPVAYRAGRYGLGPNTLSLLEARGYRLDTSMRSLYDYSSQGGPDYSDLDVDPFWCGPDRTLIELPLSNAYVGLLRGAGRSFARLPGAGLLARAGFLSRVALTPEDMPLPDALQAIRVLVDRGVRLLCFSFHSPSLVPGHTPYVRDAGDLRDFYAWWDGVFALLSGLGATPASLDDIIGAAWAGRTDL